MSILVLKPGLGDKLQLLSGMACSCKIWSMGIDSCTFSTYISHQSLDYFIPKWSKSDWSLLISLRLLFEDQWQLFSWNSLTHTDTQQQPSTQYIEVSSSAKILTITKTKVCSYCICISVHCATVILLNSCCDSIQLIAFPVGINSILLWYCIGVSRVWLWGLKPPPYHIVKIM